MKRIFNYFTMILLGEFVFSCTAGQEVPYIVAERYFQSNQVKELPSTPIVSKEEFDSLFGSAVVMGKQGLPTTIDFANQFVISVGKPEIDRQATLNPVSLKREGDNLVLFYKYVEGEKMSYSIVPCLILVVDNKYKSHLQFKEVQ